MNLNVSVWLSVPPFVENSSVVFHDLIQSFFSDEDDVRENFREMKPEVKNAFKTMFENAMELTKVKRKFEEDLENMSKKVAKLEADRDLENTRFQQDRCSWLAINERLQLDLQNSERVRRDKFMQVKTFLQEKAEDLNNELEAIGSLLSIKSQSQ